MSIELHFDDRRAWGAGNARANPVTESNWQTDGAWWWAGVPLLVLLALPMICAWAPDFYRNRVLPEGYGALELSHFIVPLAGFVIGLRLLFNKAVRRNRLWWGLILLGTLACFYTAGEEHSWGQHIFGWQTPEAWSPLNRQNETNLHNTSPLFNMLPRAVLEVAILVLGLIVPLVSWLVGPLRIRGLEPFMPSLILVPASIGALIYKLDATLQKGLDVDGGLVMRPAEAAETFYVLFMLYYLILIRRRVADIDASARHQWPRHAPMRGP